MPNGTEDLWFTFVLIFFPFINVERGIYGVKELRQMRPVLFSLWTLSEQS